MVLGHIPFGGGVFFWKSCRLPCKILFFGIFRIFRGLFELDMLL